MPNRVRLSEIQKDWIVSSITGKYSNQTELAEVYGVHRRTIQRALIERGVLTYNVRGPKPVKQIAVGYQAPVQRPLPLQRTTVNQVQEDSAMIQIVRSHGLRPDSLESTLSSPALTHANVQVYLVQLPADELIHLMTAVTKIRMGRAKEQLQRMQGAANG